MRIDKTPIGGVRTVDIDSHGDDRGFFARTYCRREFEAAGIDLTVAQTNLSVNKRRGTLRGLHFQGVPRPDPKLVQCVRGAIFDVAVDLRPASPTFRDWFGVELSAQNRRALFVPPGCAHGFLSLRDDTEVLYLMGEYYEPALAQGVRWDDPAFAIAWPIAPAVIAPRDRDYPDFSF
ncbi:dTDP-4-dehydrorhamnose 3,5-epimerase [Varunaivibrio sulfuroxidans]|uniref:dTDP-4-dehydrorhamnose 3,5-epimerase n=1 Tax=Varunaivibrio sulfuroxidans TaxID=1773489 RepID=A0A4V2UP89_9PROT|nr:dTDP-4-dehydrorhamnose 3,5-epimerase [Varunaivibrio sulfuroxidans]TCS64991.1 dTDP-4-dehydrorhamnose 3,5-epimerase [Varunaivibrio sulfuroxidans]WES29719.1 dTDP-4-dehydrorhamnose 3,5-epimerase [Varunaivibrio sulfuroxidans]